MASTRPPPTVPVADGAPMERVDAARNRTLLVAAARRLIADHGVEHLTMDAVAAAAGVGKGTLFRRFGTRAGLMLVLLDEDAKVLQQDSMFGEPPMGPGAPPLRRLLAYGHRRMRFNLDHRALLAGASRQPHACDNPAAMVERRHISMLLGAAGTTGDLDMQTEALLALLDSEYLVRRMAGGATLDDLTSSWNSVVHKLCRA